MTLRKRAACSLLTARDLLLGSLPRGTHATSHPYLATAGLCPSRCCLLAHVAQAQVPCEMLSMHQLRCSTTY